MSSESEPKNHDGPHAWREDGLCTITFCTQGVDYGNRELVT